MIISKNKLEKIKKINNDDSDLVLKIIEYLESKPQYISTENVYEDIADLKKHILSNEKSNSTQYLFFTINNIDMSDINSIQIQNKRLNSEKMVSQYYYGSEHERKVEFYEAEAQDFVKKYLDDNLEVGIIIDISSVSSYPLWNTVMRRRMNSIVKSIEKCQEESISQLVIRNILYKSSAEEVKFKDLYDIDFVIAFIKRILQGRNAKIYWINSEKSDENIFLLNELVKFTYALNLKHDERYEYIYDTLCKDLDEMFSKYNFCNFKENKCIAQRHRKLFNNYPVPKTDGCCFKVVRKCEHNNKDGTCKVKCLPCKLFACPFLDKFDVGIKASELILIRAFLNNKQKRIVLYKFYNSKEFLLEKIKEAE